MKYFTLITIIFFFSSTTQSQNCTDIILNSQSAVDNFNCVVVFGNLTISGTDINDLSPLNKLKSVENLIIIDNPKLKNLDGLVDLESAFNISIKNNSILSNVRDLSSVRSNTGTIEIINNPQLANVDGFQNVNGGWYITIKDNASLTNIDALSKINNVQFTLLVENNPMLQNLNGLLNVRSIGTMTIRNNPSLLDLDGMQRISTITGDLEIINNDNLKHIDILKGVSNFSNSTIRIIDNSSLEHLNGLSELFIAHTIEIKNNNSLIDLSGLSGIPRLATFIINDNDELPNVDGLVKLEEIYGRLEISGNNSLKNVDGFSNLTKISAELIITNNSSLENLDGFINISRLPTINTAILTIESNSILSDCCGIIPILRSGSVDELSITNNPLGCSSESDVLTSCDNTPKAKFSSTANTGKAPFVITYSDESTGNPNEWIWLFPGGSPSSSTLQHPSVTYSTPGTYDVTLRASNVNGSDIITKTAYVTVNNTINSQLNIYNKITNNSFLSTPKLIAQGTMGSPDLVPAKICADSSKATFFEFSNIDPSIDPTLVRFRIKSDPNQINPAMSGRFTTSDYTFGIGMVKAYFSHPSYYNGSDKFRSDTVEIINTATGDIIFEYPLQIYRAPVMMVHGFIGNRSTFEIFESQLLANYPAEILHRLGYSVRSLNSFRANRKIIPNGIDELFLKTRAALYSSGRADVVGHSMGGLLTRLYLQENYNLKYRDDIYKLICLNTPHSGSQVADFVFEANSYAGIILSFIYRNSYATRITEALLRISAVDDMRVNSPSIDQRLNGDNLNLNTVLSYTKSTHDVNSSDFCFGLGLALSVSPTILGPDLNTIIFDGEENDLVVSESSQKGGILLSQPHFDQCHIGAATNEMIIDEVKGLLLSPQIISKFSFTGFDPPDLNYFAPPIEEVQKRPVQTAGEISFISPVSGSIYEPGDIVSVKIEGTDIDKITFAAGNEIIPLYMKDTIASSIIFHYEIPTDALGEIRMIAFGSDTTTSSFDVDSTRIIVNSNIALDSISVYPRALYIPTNSIQSLSVYGHFTNGEIKELSFDKSIQYIIANQDITSQTGASTFIGNKAGITDLAIFYKDQANSIPIEVYQGDISPLVADFSLNKQIICLGQSIKFENKSEGANSYIWNFGDGTTSSEITPTHSYNTPGSFDISLIALDLMKGEADTIVFHNHAIVHPLPVVNINPDGNLEICKGEEIEITASGGVQYSWNTGDQKATIKVDEAQVYIVTVTDSNNCSNLDSIKVDLIEVEIPIITFSNDTLYSSEGVTYQWYLNGQTIPGAQSQIFIPLENGNYTVVIEDKSGCIATSEKITVIINSLRFLDLENLKIYPNPTNNSITIHANELHSFSDIFIQLYDFKGALTIEHSYEKVIGHFQKNINLSDMPAGIYTLKLQIKDELLIKKIALIK